MPIISDLNPGYEAVERDRERQAQERQSTRAMMLQLLGLGVNTALNVRGQDMAQERFDKSLAQENTQFDALQARLKQSRDDMLAARDREWKKEVDERSALARYSVRPDPEAIGPPPNEAELAELPLPILREMATRTYYEQLDLQKTRYASAQFAKYGQKLVETNMLTPEELEPYLRSVEAMPELAGKAVDALNGLVQTKIAGRAQAARGMAAAEGLEPFLQQMEASGVSNEEMAPLRMAQFLIGLGDVEPGKFLDKAFELRERQRGGRSANLNPDLIRRAAGGDMDAAVQAANSGYTPALTHALAMRRNPEGDPGVIKAKEALRSAREAKTAAVKSGDPKAIEKAQRDLDAAADGVGKATENARNKNAPEKDSAGGGEPKPAGGVPDPKREAIKKAKAELGPGATAEQIRARAQEIYGAAGSNQSR